MIAVDKAMLDHNPKSPLATLPVVATHRCELFSKTYDSRNAERARRHQSNYIEFCPMLSESHCQHSCRRRLTLLSPVRGLRWSVNDKLKECIACFYRPAEKWRKNAKPYNAKRLFLGHRYLTNSPYMN